MRNASFIVRKSNHFGQFLNSVVAFSTFALCLAFPLFAADSKILDALKAPELRHTETYTKFAPAVVGITCLGSVTGSPGFFTGTGAVISPDGWIVSNITTVPKDAHEIKVYFTDGHVRTAEFKAADAKTEGALIKVDGKDLPYMRVSDSKDYKVGDPVYSWGNPFESIQKDGGVSLSAGNISGLYSASSVGKGSTYFGPVIETDAAVNPGSDGGPLCDGDGNLIGVLSLATSRTRFLGLAIPSALLAEKLPDFKAIMKPRRAALTLGEQLKVNAIQAAFEQAAETVGKAVITLRIVREKDKVPAPEDFRKVEVKMTPPVMTDLVAMEARRPVDSFSTAFIVTPDGVALTAYFNVDNEEHAPARNPRRGYVPPNGRDQGVRLNNVKKIYAYLPDGKRVEAKLLGVYKSVDLAAIKLDIPEGTKLPFINVEASDCLGTGMSTAILGRSEPPGNITLNVGHVSGQCRLRNTSCQVNALMNYGNIGGPAIDLDGKLLGMAANLTTTTDWRQNCGVGFLLTAAEIKKALPDLIAGKIIEGEKTPMLGVIWKEDGAATDSGARIGEVLPGSAAAKGGIKAGDLIVEYNGEKVRDFMNLKRITQKLKIGDTVPIKVSRDGATVELKVTFTEAPPQL